MKLQSVDTAFTNRKATFVKQLQRGFSYTLPVNFRSSFEETIIVTPSYIELSFEQMDPAPQTLTVTPMKGPNIDPTRTWTLTTPTSSWLWLTLNANGTGGGTTLNGTGQQTVYLRPGQNSGNAPRYVNISLDDKKNPVKVVTNVKQNYFEAIGETGTGIERIYIEDNGYNPKLLLTKNNSNPGAFFQFGGIRGWKQPSGNITNIPAAYNPSHIGSGWSSGWTPVGYNAGYVVTHTLESLRAGTGDPCRLVGYTKSEIEAAIHSDNPNAYAPDNKVWRLPIGGQLQGFTTNSETFPRFGYIYSETNNYLDNGTMGYYWGSWQSAGGATYTNAGLLRSSSSSKIMWSLPPASAMNIRCVNQ